MQSKKFGKYIVQEHLGSGAYAAVFKAYDPTLDRHVALKLLRPELSRDVETRQRFLNEARALGKLEHPNIAWVYEIGQVGSQDFIAIKYIEGPSLDKYLSEKGTLSWEKAFKITTNVARALQYAHEHGMIHRDVKPGNIILGPDGAVLTDFGLVKSLDGSVILSQSRQQMIGTWWYMATEIINEQPATPASDQFSLACTLVEMLTGKSPFYANTPIAVAQKHLMGVELPENYGANVPPHIKITLQKALSKEPQHRYTDMHAFVKAISQSAPTEVKPEKPAISNPAVSSPRGYIDNKVGPAPNGSTGSSLGVTKTPNDASAIKALPQTQRAPVMETAAVKKKSSGWLLWGGLVMVFSIIEIIILLSANLNQNQTPPGSVITELREQDGMEMVYIPEGTFAMGSDDGDTDEQPVHYVYLDAYWIDKYEVTNGQYEQCVAKGACIKPNSVESCTRSRYYDNEEFGNYPVICVDWYQAQTYCEWVGGSLPTEAQWEKAAKGNDNRTYPWGNGAANSSLANYGSNSEDTTEVGSYPEGASPYGAMDMAGNVSEWTADWYDENYYSNSPRKNPTGPTSRSYRGSRGGDWFADDYGLRASVRYWGSPDGSWDFIGFRCVVSP